MGRTVRTKLPCDSCGSSDAVAEYEDGSFHCFACEKTTRGNNAQTKDYRPMVNLTGDPILERYITKWQQAQAVAIPDRNINSTSTKRYGVVVDGTQHLYPYFTSDRIPRS
jgi:twinkle protein